MNKQMYFGQQPTYLHPSTQALRQTMHTNPQIPFQQVLFSNRKLEHINCILPETQQSGGLYIGDTISTLKPEYIIDNKIQAVLCLNVQASKNLQVSRNNIDYKYVESQDHVQYPIHLHFDSTNQFIDNRLKSKKNVLVQCHAGVSRSATIICAYLIKHKQWIPQQAIKYLKEKRYRAKPNAGFMRQLDQYWYSLNKQKLKSNEIKLKSALASSKVSIQLSPSKQPARNRENSVSNKQINSTAVKSFKSFESDTSIPSSQNQKQVKLKSKEESRKVSVNKDMVEKSQSKMIRSQSKLNNVQSPFQYFAHRSSEQLQRPIYYAPQMQPQQPPQQSYQHQYQYYSPQIPQKIPGSGYEYQVAVQYYHQNQPQYHQQVQPQYHTHHNQYLSRNAQSLEIGQPWQPQTQQSMNNNRNNWLQYQNVQIGDRYEYPQDLRMSR